MLPIPQKMRERIEGLLEPGYLVTLEQVGNDILVHKRPKSVQYLHCPPAKVTGSERATLSVMVQVPGDYPCQVAAWPIESDYWVIGVMGAKTPSEALPPPDGDEETS